jgi:hypothetical protein
VDQAVAEANDPAKFRPLPFEFGIEGHRPA